MIAHGISKRTGRTGWSTLGIVLVDFIMLPVIGHTLEDKSGSAQTPSTEEKKEEVTEM